MISGPRVNNSLITSACKIKFRYKGEHINILYNINQVKSKNNENDSTIYQKWSLVKWMFQRKWIVIGSFY